MNHVSSLEHEASRPASKVPFLSSLGRSQAASLIATGCDFLVLIYLVESLGVWYVAATAMGAFVGAVINFSINRYWSFKATGGRIHIQAFRYSLVSGLSLLFNSLGVYWMTDDLGLPYVASKALTSLLVGLFFNFPMHRFYVFSLPHRT